MQSFRFRALRFEFQAERSLFLPLETAANTLRGAFGHTFRLLTERSGHLALYRSVFEPEIQGGPSGFASPPRPFVFRPRALELQGLQGFALDVHLFDLDIALVDEFTTVFRSWSAEGIGSSRTPVELIGVRSLRVDGTAAEGLQSEPLEIDLAGPAQATVEQIRVCFCTPTELKFEGRVVQRPEFVVLSARIRDRIAALMSFYQGSMLQLDFKAWGDRARAIENAGYQLQEHHVERLSSRTGQRHSIGGFTGWANYKGRLDEFIPWLEAASWTGVGRQTVWGKGEIRVERIL